MKRLCTTAVALACLLVPVTAAARQPLLAGGWQRLPEAPGAAIPYERVGVWTGRQLIVFGRVGVPGGMRNAAFSYTPSTGRWRALTPPRGPTGSYEGALAAVWTGRLVLVWGPVSTLSYEPATNRWRQLPRPPIAGAPSGLVVWTGEEMITWGGGCCGDVTEGGEAYDPATETWRTLPRAPVAGQQRPLGAWTGRELIVLPGRHADHNEPTGGAAYDPARNSWRTIASPPQERVGSTVVWDGKEVLVAGGFGKDSRRLAAVPYAYDPATNRWRKLAAMDGGRYGRADAGAVWTGSKLLLWGGRTQAGGEDLLAPHGLAYDPARDRWWTLPGAPLNGRVHPLAVWTGTSLLVWGGDPLRTQVPPVDDWWPFLDGAAFTPGR